MKTMLKTMSVAAGLSMAALALGSVAAPAMAEDVRIPVADLNLHTPEGRAQFEARANAAAWRMCGSYLALSERSSCMRVFRQAADENLQEQMQRQARQQGGSLARR